MAVTIPPMFDLSGRVAIVAGATHGIGLAFARQYLQHGGRVVIAARNAEASTAVADELNDAHGDAVAWPCAFDLNDASSIDRLVDRGVERWGRLDTLLANSYFSVGTAGSDISDDDFTKTLRTNIVHNSRMAHRALPALEASDLGCVIFVSSAAGVRPSPSNGPYGIAKQGLARLGQNLAIEWGARGVRVNIVAPGMTRTRAIVGRMDQAEIDRRVSEFPIRRLVLPDEVAAAAIFLAAPASGAMTGHELVIDCGRTLLSGNTGIAFRT